MDAIVNNELLSISGVDRIIFMEGGLGGAFQGKCLYTSTKVRIRKQRDSQFENSRHHTQKSFRGRRKE